MQSLGINGTGTLSHLHCKLLTQNLLADGIAMSTNTVLIDHAGGRLPKATVFGVLLCFGICGQGVGILP